MARIFTFKIPHKFNGSYIYEFNYLINSMGACECVRVATPFQGMSRKPHSFIINVDFLTILLDKFNKR